MRLTGQDPQNVHRPAGVVSQTAKSLKNDEFEEFVYLLSHDVRNSVRALMDLPHWIEEDIVEAGYRIDDTLAENLAFMNTHTQRLDRMLCDLLVYSRVGRMQKNGALNLNQTIDGILDQIRRPKGLLVRLQLDMAELQIGERDGITLLSALISNAIRHHDRDTGEVSITSQMRGNNQVITVCDDGPGIDPRYHERVFGMMTGLKSRDEVEGSGMGLAIARKIARYYDGQVTLTSQKDGRGASFEVCLPMSGATHPRGRPA